MKLLSILSCVITIFAGIASAETIKKFDLDDASMIGLTIESDSKVRAEGNGSVKIKTHWPVTVCLGEMTDLNIDDAKLVYKAKVKSDLKGTAFLEMWVHIKGNQYFSKGVNNPVKENSDWTSIQTPFVLQKGQKPDRITLNLVINGKGVVWIDDMELIKIPLN